MITDRASNPQLARRGRGLWSALAVLIAALAVPIAALAVLIAGLAIVPAIGCGGKPVAPPPGAEKSTSEPDIEMGNSSDSNPDAAGDASAGGHSPAGERPDDSHTEKDN